MSHTRSRRHFLQGALATGLGAAALPGRVAAQQPRSANEKLNFACIGVGGKGDSDTADAARNGNIVALCDVDERTLARAAAKYPGAKRYTDFRWMLADLGDAIDAVTVSTPDHTHAPAAAMAMRMGKHCFCQKPLTHSIWEARRLGEIAREMKVATQMGNQGTANEQLRRSAAMVRAGVLGKVREVHVWTNRPVWDQGKERAQPTDIPPYLNWDAWLGPAPERPHAPGYHAFAWRGWWDFGTGALGDMACHTLNMAFMGLDLKHPVSVEAESSGHNQDSYPKWSIIRYEFPATDSRGPITMWWYDGGKLPPAEPFEGRRVTSSGCLIIGDRGKLHSPGDYAGDRQLFGGAEETGVEVERSPGHFDEWVRAVRGGPAAVSNFPDYASPLTETVLLGNLAVWASGNKIEWDAAALVPKNAPEVEHIVRRRYRSGWAV